MLNPLIEEYLHKLYNAALCIDSDMKNETNKSIADLLCADILSYLYFLADSDNNVSVRELLYINQIITNMNDDYLFLQNIRTVSEFKQHILSICPKVDNDNFSDTVPKSYIEIEKAEKRNILPIEKQSYSAIYYDTLLMIGNELIFSDYSADLTELKRWINYMTTINMHKRLDSDTYNKIRK